MFPVTLATARLLLREFEPTDLDAIHAYGSDPEVVRFEPWGPNTWEETQAFLDRKLADQKPDRKDYEFAVCIRKENDRTPPLFGACGIRIRETTHREGFIGYALRKDCWNQGYGTEVASELVRFGFNDLGLHRIWATCHIDNLASARVLEKSGLKLEGILKRTKEIRGQWVDSRLYSAIRA